MTIMPTRINSGLPKNWSAKDSSAALTRLTAASKKNNEYKVNATRFFKVEVLCKVTLC